MKGAKPTIDFVVNGNLNLGLELAKDRNKKELLKKYEETIEGGVYSRHDSYIFHFVFNSTLDDVIKQMKKLPENIQPRVYTFMKDYNVLLCGAKVVRKRVVLKLASPPSM
jgi:hypothetical protein